MTPALAVRGLTTGYGGAPVLHDVTLEVEPGALVAGPRVLLLDEPSLGLAPQVVAQIMALLRARCDDGLAVLRQLRERQGLTVLLVEQNARSALSVADHGVVLDLGRVVVTRPATDLAHDEALRHAYLGF
jgi:branched-chain amino acid transport system ATP-binding protein